MTNHKPSPSRQEKETACTEDKRQFGEVSQSIQSPWLMALHWRNNLQGKKAVLFLLGSVMLQGMEVLPAGLPIPFSRV